MVHHSLEQLTRLAGGADNQPLPVGHQLTFGNGRHPLEVFQVGCRNQLVEVFQSHLVPGQNDDVLGEAVGLAAQGAQLLHFRVHGLQGVYPPLMEHFPEGDQHIAHRGGIVAGSVVVEGGQVQMLRHNVQLVFAQARQQILGQDQGVHVGGVKVQPHLFASCPDEADVEFRVVGGQGSSVHEFQEFRQGVLQLGGILQHLVGDAGKADDLRRQAAVGVHEGLEPLGDLAVFQHHRADLRDGLPIHLQAGGLNIEADEFVVQPAVPPAVDGDAVVHVVDEVSLHAVEDLDLVPGGMPGVREGLGYAVIRDGNGGMAPADGLLDDLLRVRQGVHIAHFRVEMQLHALHRGGILPFLVLDDVDVVGIQLNVLAVPGRLHLALHAQPHTGIDLPIQPLGLLLRQVFVDGHGAGVVRHFHMEPPHTGPPGLHTFHGEHLAAYRGIAHFQIQRLHFHGLDLDGVAHQDRP